MGYGIGGIVWTGRAGLIFIGLQIGAEHWKSVDHGYRWRTLYGKQRDLIHPRGWPFAETQMQFTPKIFQSKLPDWKWLEIGNLQHSSQNANSFVYWIKQSKFQIGKCTLFYKRGECILFRSCRNSPGSFSIWKAKLWSEMEREIFCKLTKVICSGSFGAGFIKAQQGLWPESLILKE